MALRWALQWARVPLGRAGGGCCGRARRRRGKMGGLAGLVTRTKVIRGATVEIFKVGIGREWRNADWVSHRISEVGLADEVRLAGMLVMSVAVVSPHHQSLIRCGHTLVVGQSSASAQVASHTPEKSTSNQRSPQKKKCDAPVQINPHPWRAHSTNEDVERESPLTSEPAGLNPLVDRWGACAVWG